MPGTDMSRHLDISAPLPLSFVAVAVAVSRSGDGSGTFVWPRHDHCLSITVSRALSLLLVRFCFCLCLCLSCPDGDKVSGSTGRTLCWEKRIGSGWIDGSRRARCSAEGRERRRAGSVLRPVLSLSLSVHSSLYACLSLSLATTHTHSPSLTTIPAFVSDTAQSHCDRPLCTTVIILFLTLPDSPELPRDHQAVLSYYSIQFSPRDRRIYQHLDNGLVSSLPASHRPGHLSRHQCPIGNRRATLVVGFRQPDPDTRSVFSRDR